jgi:hypothetical protein
VGGQSRNAIAAVNALDGALEEWDPNCDGGVQALAANDSVVYAGGVFWNIGGQPRASLAALDARTGTARAWNPHPAQYVREPRVFALALDDSTLYVGGTFNAIGGQARDNLAGLDVGSGALRDWGGSAGGYVWSLVAGDGIVFAGGWFPRVGSLPAIGLATLPAWGLPVTTPVAVAPLALAQNTPNPARTETTIWFNLATACRPRLEVYDLQGRLMDTVLDGRPQTAGVHTAVVQTAGWRPGCYLYRLEAGGASATKKMMVVE